MTPRIKIFGERNTGTNYLARLIRLNLRAALVPGVVPRRVDRLQRILPGQELVKDIYFSLTYRRNLGWKHARLSPAQVEEHRGRNGSDLFILTITKNPYAWLLSLYERPYHRYYRRKPDFETFLQHPWKVVRRDRCSGDLENPIALWNEKNASYLGLGEEYSFNLRSEALLADPAARIAEIRDRFGMEMRTPAFVNYENSTNAGIKRFADYQAYYLDEKWRAKLTEKAIAIINRSLDASLVTVYGYEMLS